MFEFTKTEKVFVNVIQIQDGLFVPVGRIDYIQGKGDAWSVRAGGARLPVHPDYLKNLEGLIGQITERP